MTSSWSRRDMNSDERSCPFFGGGVMGATGCWGLAMVIDYLPHLSHELRPDAEKQDDQRTHAQQGPLAAVADFRRSGRGRPVVQRAGRLGVRHRLDHHNLDALPA